MTRALFAVAEKAKMDPSFSGDYFHFDPSSSNQQSLKRKVSGSQEKSTSGTLNAIFENLMQASGNILNSYFNTLEYVTLYQTGC